MKPEAQDFEALRKLLALKRHEQPPPGYFRSFSNNVMARINTAEGDAESAWVLRLWQAVTGRPLVSGAFAATAAGLLLFGILFMQGDETALNTALTGGSGSPTTMTAVPGPAANSATIPRLAQGNQEDINSTNPLPNAVQPPSLFGPVKLNVEKVSLPAVGP
jgi:hypothetical protein